MGRAPMDSTPDVGDGATLTGEVVPTGPVEPSGEARPNELEPEPEPEPRRPGLVRLTWWRHGHGVVPFLWLPLVWVNGWLAHLPRVAWEPAVVAVMFPAAFAVWSARRYGRWTVRPHSLLGCGAAAAWALLAGFTGTGPLTSLLLLAGGGTMAAAYALDATNPRPRPDVLTAPAGELAAVDAPAPAAPGPGGDSPGEPAEPAGPPQQLALGEHEPIYTPPTTAILEVAKPAPVVATEDDPQRAALVGVFQEFGVDVEVTGVTRGPTVIRYEVTPASGVSVKKITARADDIALALKTKSVRILSPIEGMSAVGIEVPNPRRGTVLLGDVLRSPVAVSDPHPLLVGLGKDIERPAGRREPGEDAAHAHRWRHRLREEYLRKQR